MKIAILTQPLGRNYGGMMQAFALQKVLKDMGHQVVTIDYQRPQPGFFYTYARQAYRLIKSIIGEEKIIINFESHFPYIFKNTHSFIENNILLSEYIDNEQGLKNNFDKNKYDAVIVGSDQTWRPRYSPNIYNFYLDFLRDNNSIKKIAYASSFGVEGWEYSAEETKKCAELVALFDAVSVREESGVALCKKHLEVDSDCVLDPTLLLEKNDYLELIGNRYQAGANQGVFTYFLDNNEEKKSAAEHIAKKLQTKTYSCQAKCNSNSRNLDDYKMPPVEDWLASFANAEFIITDSFHGVVFSIIFGKPFVAIVNEKRGAARFESLLKKINALNCLFYDANEVSSSIKDIDLFRADAGLLNKENFDVFKNASIKFIKDNLGS